MVVYYRTIVDTEKSCIYSSLVIDYHRIIITRWRLSNHKLRIETGKYERPFVLRDERLCAICHVLEDEDHVIFECTVFNDTRIKFNRPLSINNTVKKVLYPKYEVIKETSKLLYEIDNIKEKQRVEKYLLVVGVGMNNEMTF